MVFSLTASPLLRLVTVLLMAGLTIRHASSATTVGQKPSFDTSSVTNNMVYYIKSASFNIACLASGYPKPTTTWLRNDDAVEVTKMLPQPVFFHGVMGFTNIDTLAEAYNVTGWYTCKASNQYGTIYSDIAVVAYSRFRLQAVLLMALLVFVLFNVWRNGG
eukprot:scpid97983/ scgid4146/ 